MDWEQIQLLTQNIQIAIAEGMRDGFATKEAEPIVTVNVPPLISPRDFFAGCALVGTLHRGAFPPSVDTKTTVLGTVCFEMADTLMEARGADHA